MGLFNRKKKENNVRNTSNGSNEKEVYSVNSLDGKNGIMMFDIELIGHATHRDGVKTNIFTARITKYDPEYTIYFDTSDYIGFELPANVAPNDQAMQLVMGYYDTIKSQDKSEYYIGRIDEENGNYRMGQVSYTVQEIVVKKFEQLKQLQQEKYRIQHERYKQEQADRSRREQFRIEMSARDYMAELAETRRHRLMNPTLTRVRGYADEQGKSYDDYDGVDLSTGDVLRVRKVNKVGKDGSGTYLYSGYVTSAIDEDDIEFFDLDGYAKFVCFELETRLEDIVKRGDPKEMNSVLALLSDLDRSNDENVYIGKVDRSGNIIRRDASDSTAIRMKVEELKNNYLQRIEARYNNGRREQQ